MTQAVRRIACAIDGLSAERYEELAAAFEISCNAEAAAAFAGLARWERQNAALLADGQPEPEPQFPWGDALSDLANPDAVHYLMWPWHVYALALEHEEKCLSWWQAQNEPAMVQRERQHMEYLRQQQAGYPVPPKDWAEDEDPPNWDM